MGLPVLWVSGGSFRIPLLRVSLPDCGLQSPVSPAWGAECRSPRSITWLHWVLL